MALYIKGSSCISPQETFNNPEFLTNLREYEGEYLKCIEPDYRDYLNPVLARRMGKIIKIGVSAAKSCLKDASIEIPDAIITGTGFGCLEDTEKFLISIIENNESMLSPTSFIQSTHNTISSQVALELKCHAYNLTYVHRNFSFESALLDALLQSQENTAENILVGGVDEITPNYYKLTYRLGLWKPDVREHLNLAKFTSNGSIPGEGSSFFLLGGKKSPGDYASLSSVAMIYKPKNNSEAQEKIMGFLANNNLIPADIDLVLTGINGDQRFDHIYYELINNMFKNNSTAYYKHLCGEYSTSSAFAFWVAANIIKTQNIPEIIRLNNLQAKQIKNILIYNQFMNLNHSLILLSQC